MRVPVAWLRELCPTDLTAEQLAELLALKGAHLEALERPWAGLEGVVVAHVLDVRDHPNSEKLCLASIDAGEGPTQVVVGVRNMGSGDLVPWAKPGSRVPVLDEPLGTKHLGGEVSNGMLASPWELGISHEHRSGILLLPGDLEVGADLKTTLGLDEEVLDLEIESNRPDLLSILGIAREVAGATGAPLLVPDVTVAEGDELAESIATIETKDPDGCPRYLARVIRGTGGGRTPIAVQARLTACGVRPISPVVDATNLVMLELGQPLHAFDLRRLAGPGVVVRRSEPGERLVTLDGVERELADDLLICDLERPVAIAGVMGGASSEVGPDTGDVLLESAYFDPRSVLRTSRRLQLLTEASIRFSRGTDPEGVGAAASRAARLIVEWAGGEVARGAIDVGAAPPRRRIGLRPTRAAAVLGYPVAAGDAVEALGRIGIPADERPDGTLEVEAPSFRPDLRIEEDLIEEIVRIQGYDRLPSTVPAIAEVGGEQESYEVRRRLRSLLVRAGLREAASLPFVPEEDAGWLGEVGPIRVANPPSAEAPFLRTSLLPSLLSAAARNLRRGARSVALFEVGHVFRLGDPVDEREHVAVVLAGQVGEGLYAEDRPYDVLDAKGVVEAVLDGVGVDWRLEPGADRPLHPARSGRVFAAAAAGLLGELHPAEAERFDLAGRVAVAELDVPALGIVWPPTPTFRDVPRFPPVRRDLAFVVREDVPAAAVQTELEAAAGDLLDRCLLFDVFAGGGLPAGHRSLAFSLEFRAPDRTLTDEEIEPAVRAIVERLRDAFDADLRA